MRYRAVNACIQFVPTLDGRAAAHGREPEGADGELHPVQRAMVDCHGSQCGFCTPGFVMSLFALIGARRGAPTTERGRTTPSPAICAAAPATARSSRPAKAHATAAPRRADSTASGRDAARLRPRGRRDRRGRRRGPPVLCARTSTTLARAAASSIPRRQIVAGATDVGLWVTKSMRVLDRSSPSARVTELQASRTAATASRSAPAVTYTERMRGAGRALSRHRRDLRRFGSAAGPQRRHDRRQHRQRLADRRHARPR